VPTSLFSAASWSKPLTSLALGQFPAIQPSCPSTTSNYLSPPTHLSIAKPFAMVRHARNPRDPTPQSLIRDPSSAPDPTILLSPHFYNDIQPADPTSTPNHPELVGSNSDSDSDFDEPAITITSDEHTDDGMRWHFWGRKAHSYTCPRRKDLPMPLTSLVDPHDLSDAARADPTTTKLDPQVQSTRRYHIRPAAATTRSSGPISCLRPTLATSPLQPSASDNTSCCTLTTLLGTTTASPPLLPRDIRLQAGVYTARIRIIATPENPRAVIEYIARYEALTPPMMRQHYHRVTAREFEQEIGCENRWHSERGRDGMLFGSELVEGRRRQHSGFRDGDRTEGWVETKVD
jgi:hypothetical protein